MHEMALAEGILEVVLDAARGRNVARIGLQVGRLQMVVPESLRFSYELVAEGTTGAGARIIIGGTPRAPAVPRVRARSRIRRASIQLPGLQLLGLRGGLGRPDNT